MRTTRKTERAHDRTVELGLRRLKLGLGRLSVLRVSDRLRERTVGAESFEEALLHPRVEHAGERARGSRTASAGMPDSTAIEPEA